MALNEIYLEILGFYGSPSQKGSWPQLYGNTHLFKVNVVVAAGIEHIRSSCPSWTSRLSDTFVWLDLCQSICLFVNVKLVM